MSLSLVQSRALLGLEAAAVTVEVHLANGLPSFTLVGLADVEVKEARERVRSAIQNSGLEFPNNKRITVNLAPADLPKDSGRFDLPIALGILAASGQIDGARLAGYEFAGELSLSGELRAVRGALAMSLALHADGRECFAHLVELEGFDDGGDKFHANSLNNKKRSDAKRLGLSQRVQRRVDTSH